MKVICRFFCNAYFVYKVAYIILACIVPDVVLAWLAYKSDASNAMMTKNGIMNSKKI